MDQDLRFARAIRRRSPLPIIATLGLVLLLTAAFLADVGLSRPTRLSEPAAQVT
jgi:hypothetical protein